MTAQPVPTDRRIEASPEKRFFISMLVKDIELIPAVLDLVDNSVDAAHSIRRDANDELDGLWVQLAVGPGRFSISDNCGGIPIDIARRYAFRFGRPEDFKTAEGSVGQFGVGMKRALFKLGKVFRIESRTRTTRFTMAVDVDAWAADTGPDWSFEFDEVDAGYRPAEEGDTGTTIEVEPLHPSVADDFGLTQVIGHLRTDLQLRHQAALEKGLSIKVNGERLVARPPVLLVSDLINPIHRQRQLPANGGEVELLLYAGLVGGRDEDRDEGEGDQFRASEAGWYLFCNNRLLLAADRTSVTGWGIGAAAYHPQYRQFRGYVYLWADDSALLPWNTTKTGVDQDSRVYRLAYGEMENALRAVQAVVNRAKKERQERADDQRPLVTALQQARELTLDLVPRSDLMIVPPPLTVPAPDVQRIAYSVPRQQYNGAKDVLGAESGSDVGRRTFQYFYDREVS